MHVLRRTSASVADAWHRPLGFLVSVETYPMTPLLMLLGKCSRRVAGNGKNGAVSAGVVRDAATHISRRLELF